MSNMASSSATANLEELDSNKGLTIELSSGRTWQLHRLIHPATFSVSFELPSLPNRDGYEVLQLSDTTSIARLVAYMNEINLGEQTYHGIARGYISLHDSRYLFSTEEHLPLVDEAFKCWIQSHGPNLDLIRGVLAASYCDDQSTLPPSWNEFISQCMVEIVMYHPEAASKKWDALVAEYPHGSHGQLVENTEKEVQRLTQRRTNKELATLDRQKRDDSDADDEASGSGAS